MIYIIASLILLITSIILSNKTKFNWILFSFLWFIFFLISSIYVVANYFTWKWLDESVVYHLFYWIEWAWFKWDGYIIFIWLGLLFLGLVAFCIIYYFFYKNFIKKNKHWLIQLLSFSFLLCSFLIHPITKNILELNWYFINNYFLNSNLITTKWLDNLSFKDNYKIPKNQVLDLNNKNLVFIYLESFESLYLDEDLFPGLSKWLNKLKEESINFTNIRQSYWAGRTIAWMVASQCWIPLITSGWWWNSMYWIDSFLPWAVCIWDFLNNAWYNLNYIWWSKLEFAWKWNFYKTHWFSNVEWKEELLSEIPDKKYNYDWGLYDDTLFDIAFNRYEKLSEENKRFWLFLINMDTHWSKWVNSRKCNNLDYNNTESILNSYYCSDKLVSDFINKIKSDENFKNTTIVLMSDHLAMAHNNSIDILNKKEDERRLLFFILNWNIDNNNKNEINKNGSTLDVWATVLSSIWFDVNQFGLGFNLLSNTGYTIKDQNPNIILSKWKNEYESFWDYPSIDNWISVDIKKQEIDFKNTKLKLPALIEFNNNLEIRRIKWHDKYSPTSLFQKIDKNTNSILIDYCKNIKGQKGESLCLYYSLKDWINKVYLLDKNIFIWLEDIKRNLNK